MNIEYICLSAICYYYFFLSNERIREGKGVGKGTEFLFTNMCLLLERSPIAAKLTRENAQILDLDSRYLLKLLCPFLCILSEIKYCTLYSAQLTILKASYRI